MSTVTPRQRIEGPQEYWYRSAALDERLRLFTAPSIAAFCASMLLALWLALPGASLVERLSQSSRSDLLTVAYLRAWLAAQPGDLPLHLALARKHLGLGDWDAAIAALAVPIASGSPALRRDAQWLKFDVLEQRMAASPPGSEARAEASAAVREQLRRLVALQADGPPDPIALDALWRRARAGGESALALALLQQRMQLGAPPGIAADAWAAQLSADAEALGDAMGAARMRWRAFDLATGDAERRAHFFAAVRLMQAADRTRDALTEADSRFDRMRPDTGMLRFMVKLALAAGRPDVAERYAREMLRFALQQQWDALLAADDTPSRDGLRPVSFEPRDEIRAKRPQLPFDDATYTLAYEVFLANRNHADALEVATSAVRQAPEDLGWRRRLAQVAEWSARPAIALEQWLAIARRTGSVADWDRVERLAGALREGAVLLESLRVRAARGSDETLELRIAQLLEDAGDPRMALAWLGERIANRGAAGAGALVERQLALLESIGDVAGALEVLDRVDAAQGSDPTRAMRRAAIHLQRGDVTRAFEALHTVRDRVALLAEPPTLPGTEDDFWTLYAQLAEQLQRDVDADLAYRTLVKLGRAGPEQLAGWSALLEPRSPRAAAVVAEYAWERGRKAPHAERAFSLWLQLGDFESLERVGASMEPTHLSALKRDVVYLQALSTHLQQTGDDTGARRALEQALVLAPDDAGLRASVLWLMLSQRAAAPLRAALLKGDRRAEREPALWGVHAAGWMALDEPQRALRWFVRQARQGGPSDDYLWQLAYADCLEQVGMVDSAWSVRRRAWLELRRLPPEARAATPWRRQATLALAMRFAPADSTREALRRLAAEGLVDPGGRPRPGSPPGAPPGLPPGGPPNDIAGPIDGPDAPRAEARAVRAHVVEAPPDDPRSLLARVAAELAAPRGSPDGETPSPANRLEARQARAGGRELVVSWMLSRESSDAARAWLLSRYATQLSRPAWAQLSVALADGDREALTTLLDDLPDWLPRMEQADAMRATGRRAAAQTVAWTVHAERGALDDAHQRLLDASLPDASFVTAEASQGQVGVLGIHAQRLVAQRTLRPGLALGAVIEHERQRSLDAAQLLEVPSDAGRLGATLRWQGESVGVEAEVARLFAVRDRTGAKLTVRPQPYADRGPSIAIGLRQPASESAPLRVGGMKDVLELRWSQPITARDQLSATVAPTRLMSQDGSTLGTGTVWSFEAVHRLRLEYPDLSFKALLFHSEWNPRTVADSIVAPRVPAALGDPTAAVIPVSSTELAAGVSFGDTVAQTYSRALRPFGEALLRANSVSGAGYALRAGFTASVLGTDRLSVFLQILSRTPGIPGGTRALGAAYQFLF